jgi:hypothetical protein
MRGVHAKWRGAMLGLVAAAACGTEPASSPGSHAAIARIELAPATLALTARGERRRLSARAYDESGNPVRAEISWSSSAPTAVKGRDASPGRGRAGGDPDARRGRDIRDVELRFV